MSVFTLPLDYDSTVNNPPKIVNNGIYIFEGLEKMVRVIFLLFLLLFMRPPGFFILPNFVGRVQKI